MKNAKWSSIVLVVSAWTILVAGWAWYYVRTALAGPVYEDYANSVGFQWLMFAIFRLPIAIMLLGAAIIVVNRRSGTTAAVEQKSHPPDTSVQL